MGKRDSDRSVKIGGDAEKSVVVTGDDNQVAVSQRNIWKITIQAIQRRWLAAVIVLVSIAIALILFSVGIGINVTGKQERIQRQVDDIPDKAASAAADKVVELYKNPNVLAGELKSQIEDLYYEQIAEARRNSPKDWKKRDDIAKRRDRALKNVDELVAKIRGQLPKDADPIFAEAARILATRGFLEAIAFLESKQQEIIERVDEIIDRQTEDELQKRSLLNVLLLTAVLHEGSLQWEKAIEVYSQVAAKAPQWSRGRRRFGSLLVSLGDFANAKHHLEAALRYASDDDERVRAQDDLGSFFRLDAQWLEAKKLFEQNLALTEKLYGPDDPHTAHALNNVGLLLLEMNRPAEAVPLFHRTSAIAEKSYGPDQPEVTPSLNNLALALQATNRRAEAELLMRRVLAIEDQSDVVNPRSLASYINNLAALLQRTNRLKEAEQLHRSSLAIRESTLFPDHPGVAVDLNNLAKLLKDTNHPVEAELLMRRALAIDRQSYARDHPILALDLNNLAFLLEETKRLEEAEQMYRCALNIAEPSRGPKHPFVATCLNNLAVLLKNTGRLAAAESLYRRALAIHEQSPEVEVADTTQVLNDLAELLTITNRSAAAEPLMRRALAINMKTKEADNPDIARNLKSLAGVLRLTKRWAAAITLIRRALVIHEESLGPEHPRVAGVLNELVILLKDTKRPVEAEQLYLRVMEIFRRFTQTTGQEHRHLQAAWRNYRRLLVEFGYPPDEISRRLRETMAMEVVKLEPINPKVEQLLGPAEPVSQVLMMLDHQDKSEGRPSIYFLPHEQPITPDLNEFLKLYHGDALTWMGTAAYQNGDYAQAVVLHGESLEWFESANGTPEELFRTRMNMAASLRELGDVQRAQAELRHILTKLKQDATKLVVIEGRSHYELALCYWNLRQREAAQREVRESLKSFAQGSAEQWPLPMMIQHSKGLLAALEKNEPFPLKPSGDFATKLERARHRFRATEILANLALDKPVVPHLDQMLGPTRPIHKVLNDLDQDYRQAGSVNSFVPLDKPISPQLDELLGPAKSLKEVLVELDRQYRDQGKSAIWFLSLDEPISPCLDELLAPLLEGAQE